MQNKIHSSCTTEAITHGPHPRRPRLTPMGLAQAHSNSVVNTNAISLNAISLSAYNLKKCVIHTDKKINYSITTEALTHRPRPRGPCRSLQGRYTSRKGTPLCSRLRLIYLKTKCS